MKSQTSFTSALLAALIGNGQLGSVPTPTFRGPTPAKQSRKGGTYGRGLRNHFAGLQRERLAKVKVGVLRDEHGSYTVTGRDSTTGEQSRKWLAGISAQRGY